MVEVRLLDQHGNALPPARRRAMAGNATPFDAAEFASREMEGFNPHLGSPDGESLPYRDTIVSRIRDVVRNDGWASGGVTRIVDSVIGADLRLASKPDYRSLAFYDRRFDAVWGQEFSRAVEALWRDFSNNPGRWCDAARQNSMSQIFRLAFRHKLIEGDALAVLRWDDRRRAGGRGHFATYVQLVDPDRLSNPYRQPDTETLRGGVEIDIDGAAQAYHIRKGHPGDWYAGSRKYEWERVPRETDWGRAIVVHDFDADRAGQTRSVGGIFTPVIARLKMLTRYDATELQSAIINAVFAAFIESPFDNVDIEAALIDDENGMSAYQRGRAEFHGANRISVNGARIPRLFPGEKINFPPASRPSSNFEAFESAVLRNVASAAGLSLEQFTQDWSKTNYSSARGALLEVWKTLSRRRYDFGHGFCTPIYAAWLEEAIENERLPMPRNAPDYIIERAAYARCKWIGPARGWVDPVKERDGAIIGMTAGLSTLEQECEEQGVDWLENLDQRALELKEFELRKLPVPQWLGPSPQSYAQNDRF